MSYFHTTNNQGRHNRKAIEFGDTFSQSADDEQKDDMRKRQMHSVYKPYADGVYVASLKTRDKLTLAAVRATHSRGPPCILHDARAHARRLSSGPCTCRRACALAEGPCTFICP